MKYIAKIKQRCVICGKTFLAKKGKNPERTRRWCSSNCRKIRNRKYNAKFYHKHREEIRKKYRTKYHDEVSNNPERRKILNERSNKAMKKYYQKNKEIVSARKKKWWKERGSKIYLAKKEGKTIKKLKQGRPFKFDYSDRPLIISKKTGNI